MQEKGEQDKKKEREKREKKEKKEEERLEISVQSWKFLILQGFSSYWRLVCAPISLFILAKHYLCMLVQVKAWIKENLVWLIMIKRRYKLKDENSSKLFKIL